MKQIWSILCLRSLIDQETNNISLIDCLEQISIQISEGEKATKDKVFPIAFDLVSLFVDNEDVDKERKYDFVLETIGVSGEKLGETFGKIIIAAGAKRLRHRVKIQGLKINESGTYLFRVKYKNENEKDFKDLAEVPLEVNVSYKLM